LVERVQQVAETWTGRLAEQALARSIWEQSTARSSGLKEPDWARFGQRLEQAQDWQFRLRMEIRQDFPFPPGHEPY